MEYMVSIGEIVFCTILSTKSINSPVEMQNKIAEYLLVASDADNRFYHHLTGTEWIVGRGEQEYWVRGGIFQGRVQNIRKASAYRAPGNTTTTAWLYCCSGFPDDFPRLWPWREALMCLHRPRGWIKRAPAAVAIPSFRHGWCDFFSRVHTIPRYLAVRRDREPTGISDFFVLQNW